jgi:hypothetical protein
MVADIKKSAPARKIGPLSSSLLDIGPIFLVRNAG